MLATKLGKILAVAGFSFISATASAWTYDIQCTGEDGTLAIHANSARGELEFQLRSNEGNFGGKIETTDRATSDARVAYNKFTGQDTGALYANLLGSYYSKVLVPAENFCQPLPRSPECTWIWRPAHEELLLRKSFYLDFHTRTADSGFELTRLRATGFGRISEHPLGGATSCFIQETFP